LHEGSGFSGQAGKAIDEAASDFTEEAKVTTSVTTAFRVPITRKVLGSSVSCEEMI
jgi:hypothetical protein